MKNLCVILGDQLNMQLSSLQLCNKANDVILMAEVWEEATYVAHHKKKIAFLFSAMRHFAHELEAQGYQVRYTRLDDKVNTGSIRDEVARALQDLSCSEIIITEPGEYRLLKDIQTWQAEFNIPVQLCEDNRFLCTHAEFKDWASDRKQLRMEYFYRMLRQRDHILMDDAKPLGGQWNFDASNRKSIPIDLNIPNSLQIKPNNMTQTVINLVKKRFAHHFGDIEPFHYAVTRTDALRALHLFIHERLAQFGDYQDAMLNNDDWLFHAHISLYINCGLLLPRECITAAEQALQKKRAPLNAVEGFIRQILGWREFIRGIYWLKMPEYAASNYFQATRPLPDFYWTGDTQLHCLKQCVKSTAKHAYAHHIQRLMVLGNFALLTGISPQAVNEWFLIVYADAYEWVELPNVTGMALFADGGVFASKPYAAGGNYIHKMSDYCQHCVYDVKEKIGANACPFNYLYWDFLVRHRKKLARNPRINMLYKTYDRMPEDKKQAIHNSSQTLLNSLRS